MRSAGMEIRPCSSWMATNLEPAALGAVILSTICRSEIGIRYGDYQRSLVVIPSSSNVVERERWKY